RPAGDRAGPGSPRRRRARSRRRTPAGSTARPPNGPSCSSLPELLQKLLRVGRLLGVRVLLDGLVERLLGLGFLLGVALELGPGQQLGRFPLVATGLRLVLTGRLLSFALGLVLRVVLLGRLLGSGAGAFFIPVLLGVCGEENRSVLLVARLRHVYVPAPR